MKAYNKSGNLLINTNDITFRVFDTFHGSISRIHFEEDDCFVKHHSSELYKSISLYDMPQLEEVRFFAPWPCSLLKNTTANQSNSTLTYTTEYVLHNESAINFVKTKIQLLHIIESKLRCHDLILAEKYY